MDQNITYDIPDLHTHILPGIDDGSKSISESIAMLNLLAAQGVRQVVATPHFNPQRDTPDEFLARRNHAAKSLYPEYDTTQHPKIYLGAEVCFFHEIGSSAPMKRLCIEGTNYILIEMPYVRWTEQMIESLLSLREYADLIPILAHLERYFQYVKMDTLHFLSENGLLFQVNARFLSAKKAKRKTVKLFRQSKIGFIGSDCHNMTNRTPNMDEAFHFLEGNIAPEYIFKMESAGKMVLSKATPMEELLTYIS